MYISLSIIICGCCIHSSPCEEWHGDNIMKVSILSVSDWMLSILSCLRVLHNWHPSIYNNVLFRSEMNLGIQPAGFTVVRTCRPTQEHLTKVKVSKYIPTKVYRLKWRTYPETYWHVMCTNAHYYITSVLVKPIESNVTIYQKNRISIRVLLAGCCLII